MSLEQYAAEQLGFTVTVVNGSTWAAMTAADFAKYQVLIIGDPTCNVSRRRPRATVRPGRLS